MRYDTPEIETFGVEQIEVAAGRQIEVAAGRRPLHQGAVDRLAESMAKIGLRTPITVRHFEQHPDGSNSDCLMLVSGAHRLAAAKKLGWKEIPCFCLEEEPDEDARLWEIAENLHRADLTKLERATYFKGGPLVKLGMEGCLASIYELLDYAEPLEDHEDFRVRRYAGDAREAADWLMVRLQDEYRATFLHH